MVANGRRNSPVAGGLAGLGLDGSFGDNSASSCYTGWYTNTTNTSVEGSYGDANGRRQGSSRLGGMGSYGKYVTSSYSVGIYTSYVYR